MAGLIKYVKANGGGDYTDLISGITDILASGLAGTGVYDTYTLMVDSSGYVGNFTANVPYTGILSVIGSGTWFYPDSTCYISGVSDGGTTPNLVFENFNIVASGASVAFSVGSGAGFALENTTIMDGEVVINSSGYVQLSEVKAHGTNNANSTLVNDFLGNTSLVDCSIGYFNYGIRSHGLSVENTVMMRNSIGIDLSGDCYLTNVLIESSTGSGVVGYVTPTGALNIRNSTIDCYVPIISSGYLLVMDRDILYGNSYCILGTYYGNSRATDCVMYPNSYSVATISGVRIATSDPVFNDRTNNDYKLTFKQTTGSPCINYVDQGKVTANVDLLVDQGQLVITDSVGRSTSTDFYPFIYKQDSSLLFSDYNKEIEFAETKAKYDSLRHNLYIRAEFTASGVDTIASFSPDLSDPHPWDWDIKSLSTTEITDLNTYLIPRSVVDVRSAMSGHLLDYVDSVVFTALNKDSITPYLLAEYRGVAYDFDLSTEGGNAILWMIEGVNQHLIKMDAYSSERKEVYPLFVAAKERTHVYPSGLIAAGVFGNKYKFLLESDPSIEYFSESQDGRFAWIAPSLDLQKDARGVLAYKDNLFVTVSEYSNPIYNRSSVPNNTGIGKLLVYDNNSTFEHYIANYSTDSAGPSGMVLASGNQHPTDLTVYEDGTLFIADYGQTNLLYKYQLAYDYAIVQAGTDRESRVLLRENYDNVEL